MFDTIREDIRTVFAKDPAARNTAEIILFYPGLHALWMHRKANWKGLSYYYIFTNLFWKHKEKNIEWLEKEIRL